MQRRRRQAVEAVRAGERPAAVARVLGVGRGTVSRWLQDAARPGGLAAKPRGNPPPKPTPAQDRELVALSRRGADAHGWANRLWTAARVAAPIRRHFGVTYHPDHVGRFLRMRLHRSPQKPRRKARERDEDAIARGKAEAFPRIAHAARDRGAHRVFLDESGYMPTPTVRRTRAPRGETPVLSCWDRRDRLSAIGAITVSPERGRPNLYSDVMADNANVAAGDVTDFLDPLRSRLGERRTVLWDGGPVRGRSKAVRAYLAEHPDIVAETLPAYAPELNPDQLVWGWSKYGRRANPAAADTGWLRDYVLGELIDLKAQPRLLNSFIRHTGLTTAA